LDRRTVCKAGWLYLIFNIPSVVNCISQLTKKIIPAFENVHGPGYQALIMVDNSQGHSAYAVDALLVSQMNMKPGGKQACM
jgi:hypothetical protein